ncbi:MAG: ATP-binding protein [Roseateles sp.]|uniref:ATP-binding protein n=1 Tax=Roseateles sp. TaxID=1971397 RepID=UPI00403501F4
MKRIGSTLAAVLLLACLGLGLLIELLHERLSSPPAQPEVWQQTTAVAQALATVLNRKDGEPLPAGLSVQPRSSLPLPPDLQADFERGQPLLLETGRGLSLHLRLPDGERLLTLQLPPEARLRGEQGLSLALTLLFYLGLLAFVLLWLRPLLQRLEGLRQAARGFGQGQLDRRVAHSPRSHIAEIEVEFNRMAQRIQTLIEDNRLLGSAVSHDLRTPLARLRFGIEALGETQDAAARERYRQHLSRDIAAMESLVELLLGYARLEQLRATLPEQTLALRPLIEGVVAGSAWVGGRPQLSLDLQDLQVRGEPHYLRMLLDNLLQNAFRHARSTVRLSLSAAAGAALLCVEDDGPGIAPAQRDQVLKPFVRGPGHEGAGHGLGLAIVARIADWHGAQLGIDASPALGGARITLRFPTPA